MIDKKDLKIEKTCGKGPGGQHKNKTASCVKVTHIPTGINVRVDGRHQHKNLKEALALLEIRLQEAKDSAKAKIKKDKRDRAIHDTKTIRTYDYKSGLVKDHRTKKTATIKEIMEKGKLELLQ